MLLAQYIRTHVFGSTSKCQPGTQHAVKSCGVRGSVPLAQPFIFEYATASVVVPFLVTVDGPVSASNALDRRPRLESFLELAGALMDVSHSSVCGCSVQHAEWLS